MTAQASLFDLMHHPAILLAVDPDGPVVQGPVGEVLSLPRARNAVDLARIELHQHAERRFMWSTSFNLSMTGCGYRVGQKWGKFAESRGDALHYAVLELVGKLTDRSMGCDADTKLRNQIIKWANGLN